MIRVSVLLVGLLIAESAMAWTCQWPDQPMEQYVLDGYEISDIVFKGRSRTRYGTWVEVDTVWKGTVPPLVAVTRGTKWSDTPEVEVLFFGKGPKKNGMYTSFGHNDCFGLPDYKVTLEVLNRVYGPGSPPRENNFAVIWFVTLSPLLLVGACLCVWPVVRKGGVLGFSDSN